VTYRIIRPDHSIRWIRSQAFPVFEADGTFQRIAGIAEDITERVRYESQLKRLSQRLVTVLDNERIRIARELHDQVGQQLTGLSLSLAVIQAQCAPDHPAVPRLDDATELISTIIERIRLIITDLRPLVLDDMGLAAGLRWYCEKFTRRTTIPVTLNLPQTEVSFTPMIANAFYQIAQEALMNVAKHAAATHAWITLEVDPKQLKLTIGDDGRGFDAQTLRDSDYDGCWGLQIMQERTEGIVGSRLYVDSQPGEGTRITVRMQL
jgi:signal transduction histidine kinase